MSTSSGHPFIEPVMGSKVNYHYSMEKGLHDLEVENEGHTGPTRG